MLNFKDERVDKMSIENLVTNRELSLRLKEAGVPQRSVFYWVENYSGLGWTIIDKKELDNTQGVVYSAYLAGELELLLPIGIDEQDILVIERWKNGYDLSYKDYGGTGKQYRGGTHNFPIVKDTLANSLGELVFFLISIGHSKVGG